MEAPHLLLTDQEIQDSFVQKLKAKKTLLWFAIISIIMLFAALTSAYIVRQAEGKWVQFELPKMFIASTVVILLSSIPMQWAVASAKKNNQKNLKTALVLVALLGSCFVFFQYTAWTELFSQGIAFAGQIKDIKGDYTYVRAGTESPSDIASMGNVAGSFLYVITGPARDCTC
jgi:cytochrome c oxidase subunit 3